MERSDDEEMATSMNFLSGIFYVHGLACACTGVAHVVALLHVDAHVHFICALTLTNLLPSPQPPSEMVLSKF